MREQILSKSMILFQRYGIKSVTMDDIAKELGISKKTLYENFDRKESILIECINMRIDQDRLFNTQQIDLLNQLLDCMYCIEKIDRKIKRRCFHDILKYHKNVYLFLLKLISDYAMACKQKVYDGVEQGFIRKDTSPDFVYFSLLRHLSKLFFGDEAMVTCDYMTQSVLVFARGISTAEGRTYIDKELKKRKENETH